MRVPRPGGRIPAEMVPPSLSIGAMCGDGRTPSNTTERGFASGSVTSIVTTPAASSKRALRIFAS